MKYRKPFYNSFLALAALSAFSNQTNYAEEPDDRPNILWITCEDISPNLGCYGDTVSKTPFLDKLASEGIRYTNAFSCAGVCAPSRSSIITGMYQTSIGTHNMRTGEDVFGISKGVYNKNIGLIDPEGNTVPEYSTVIPPFVKCFTEYLRMNGYYCTNNSKTDYQFAPPITAWDECSDKAHWRNRPKGKPFFAVFNFLITHESRIWMKKNDPLLINLNSPSLPPYFPEDSVVRQDVARDYSNIAELDKLVADLVQQLKDDGLLENTIIFFFSDHGGPLPRGKREIYDSGIHTPLIIRFPNGKYAGTVCNDLVSYVDLAPTVLSLADIKPLKYMQGQPFLGKYKAKGARKYIFAARDRMDAKYDRVRIVRNHDFLYVKNFRPDLPNYQDIIYRKQMDMMNELLLLHKEGKLNEVQEIWFRDHKPVEELYLVNEDPFQIHNIAEDPEYASQLKVMRKALDNWLKDVGDQGSVPEGELIRKNWPNLEQPQTAMPEIKVTDNEAMISCSTDGASIAWQITPKGMKSSPEWKNWHVYSEPVRLQKNEVLHAVAIRIGYKQSEESKTD